MKRKITALDWINNKIKSESLNEDRISLGLNNKVKKKFDKKDVVDNISDYVDLGFPSGNLWGIYNVGAENENEYGDYFTFDEGNSQYSLPSKNDYKEFIENTTSEYDRKKGGVVFTSLINGNSIFFPLAGYCDDSDIIRGKGTIAFYWTSDEAEPKEFNRGYAFYTNFSGIGHVDSNNLIKKQKNAIRTVFKKRVDESLGLGMNQKVKSKFRKVDSINNIDTEYVDLGLPSGLLWKACNEGAKDLYEFGNYVSFDSASNLVDYKKIPLSSDYNELMHYTSRRWDPDKKGIWLTSVINGNEIFFPACGFKSSSQNYKYDIDINEAGYYWTSTEDNLNKGKCFCFDINDTEISQIMKASALCIRTIKI